MHMALHNKIKGISIANIEFKARKNNSRPTLVSTNTGTPLAGTPQVAVTPLISTSAQPSPRDRRNTLTRNSFIPTSNIRSHCQLDR
jgi:hypothetical protein